MNPVVIFLFVIFAGDVFGDNETLQQVHIIFRHGNRTPTLTSIIPNNHQNVDWTFPPYGPGQLTLAGKKSAYKLGKFLSKKYGKFFNSFEAYSSNFPRTQMSLQCVLTGLFPPSKEEEIENGYKWQPNLYTILKPDKFLAVDQTCNTIYDFESIIDEESKKLYKYIQEHVNITIKNSRQISTIENAILVQNEIGIDVPKWAKPLWPEKFRELADYFWYELTSKKLGDLIGHFFHELIQHTDNYISGNFSTKLFLYSAHDQTLIAILAALNNYNKTYPNYSSYIAIELHKIEDHYGFKIYFYNYESPKPVLLITPCGQFCHYDQMKIKIADKLYKGEYWCT